MTRLNLQSWLPKELHAEINHMLVGFGQVSRLSQRYIFIDIRWIDDMSTCETAV